MHLLTRENVAEYCACPRRWRNMLRVLCVYCTSRTSFADATNKYEKILRRPASTSLTAAINNVCRFGDTLATRERRAIATRYSVTLATR